jgi:3-carboxy-cis,cis-muconate cycloisomerase
VSFSPLDSELYGPAFTTPQMREVFSDAEHLKRMVQVEAALAKVQAELGLIPAEAARDIVAVCGRVQIDYQRLQRGVQTDGVPVIGLLAELRGMLGEEGRTYLHWGATTQDVVDTALILGVRDALGHLEALLRQLAGHLGLQADRHRATLIAGRTHSQQALPVTFGLKVAGWLLPLLRDLDRLAELRPRLLTLQFGGAAGTLAALGASGGLMVQEALSRELRLHTPELPWHTARDTLAELGGWLSLVSGTVGKIGQDVILLSQSEVGELRESIDRSRGGSSTMPQKSNPMRSEAMVAAARMNAGLLSGLHHALIQEHERGTHGWQLEWLTLPQMFGLTAGALRNANAVAAEMAVNAEQMRENIASSRGLMLAEAYSFALTPALGREGAKTLVTDGVTRALADNMHLADALASLPDAPPDLPRLSEENYLGATDQFIDRVLNRLERVIRN